MTTCGVYLDVDTWQLEVIRATVIILFVTCIRGLNYRGT